jgi:hypothetical protein
MTQKKNSLQDTGNYLLLMLVLLLLGVVPFYLGLIGSIVAVWGTQFWKYGLDPVALWSTYNEYLLSRAGDYDTMTQLKIYGPPGAGIFVSMLSLFLMRAPLMDFGRLKMKSQFTAMPNGHQKVRFAVLIFAPKKACCLAAPEHAII